MPPLSPKAVLVYIIYQGRYEDITYIVTPDSSAGIWQCAYLQTCSINTFQDILQRIGSDFCFEMYDMLFIASTIALIPGAWVPEIWYRQTKVDTTWKHEVAVHYKKTSNPTGSLL
jgi:hypothetical protein